MKPQRPQLLQLLHALSFNQVKTLRIIGPDRGHYFRAAIEPFVVEKFEGEERVFRIKNTRELIEILQGICGYINQISCAQSRGLMRSIGEFKLDQIFLQNISLSKDAVGLLRLIVQFNSNYNQKYRVFLDEATRFPSSSCCFGNGLVDELKVFISDIKLRESRILGNFPAAQSESLCLMDYSESDGLPMEKEGASASLVRTVVTSSNVASVMHVNGPIARIQEQRASLPSSTEWASLATFFPQPPAKSASLPQGQPQPTSTLLLQEQPQPVLTSYSQCRYSVPEIPAIALTATSPIDLSLQIPLSYSQ